jgi:hypothetical protein
MDDAGAYSLALLPPLHNGSDFLNLEWMSELQAVIVEAADRSALERGAPRARRAIFTPQFKPVRDRQTNTFRVQTRRGLLMAGRLRVNVTQMPAKFEGPVFQEACSCLQEIPAQWTFKTSA